MLAPTMTLIKPPLVECCMGSTLDNKYAEWTTVIDTDEKGTPSI